MLKIYRTRVIASGLTGEQVNHLRRLIPSLGFQESGTVLVRGKFERNSWGHIRHGIKCPRTPSRAAVSFCVRRC